jgi:hypothetical protein
VQRYLEINPAQGDDLAEPLADAPEVDANGAAGCRARVSVAIPGQLGWHPTDPFGC